MTRFSYMTRSIIHYVDDRDFETLRLLYFNREQFHFFRCIEFDYILISSSEANKSRSQSFVPFDQRSENESKGNGSSGNEIESVCLESVEKYSEAWVCKSKPEPRNSQSGYEPLNLENGSLVNSDLQF